MASPFIEFQVQNGGGDVPMTFNAYGIAFVQPIDDATCTIYSANQAYTVEGTYDDVVAALEALFP